jgi:hypothetical protein
MEQAVSDELAEIMRAHGRELLDEPRRLEGLLRECLPHSRREVAALLAALRARIPTRLCRLPPNSKVSEILASNYAARLREEHALESESARWAVSAWANALGLSMSAHNKAGQPAGAASFEMSPVAWQELKRIVSSKHREQLMEESGERLCEALLRDRCPNSKREIAALVAVLRAGDGQLCQLAADSKAAQGLVDRLVGEHGIELQAASWSVAAWGDALGISGSIQPDPKPKPIVGLRPSAIFLGAVTVMWIVLILIDQLRISYVKAGGYPVITTPWYKLWDTSLEVAVFALFAITCIALVNFFIRLAAKRQITRM